jgi:hypothetical protein
MQPRCVLSVLIQSLLQGAAPELRPLVRLTDRHQAARTVSLSSLKTRWGVLQSLT